jgi:hypothetical protein
MGNCCSNTADSDPPPPRSEPPPPPPEPAPAPTPSQNVNVREKVDDRPPEPGPARAHAPASYHRSRSKSAHPSTLRSELPPLPSPPVPVVRPRAVTGPGRSKFENLSNVPQNSPQPIPRTNRKSAPNDSGRRQFNSTVWSVLSDNFRYPFSRPLISHYCPNCLADSGFLSWARCVLIVE